MDTCEKAALQDHRRYIENEQRNTLWQRNLKLAFGIDRHGTIERNIEDETEAKSKIPSQNMLSIEMGEYRRATNQAEHDTHSSQ